MNLDYHTNTMPLEQQIINQPVKKNLSISDCPLSIQPVPALVSSRTGRNDDG
jgi:hypothetical protein